MDSDAELTGLATGLGQLLFSRKLSIATAESCTGGWIAQTITSVAGSSSWFDRGFVTYSNASKTDMLGVDSQLIETYGAVSEETARAMAQGAVVRSKAQLALAVTGIAGPDGGSDARPVGTVWLAWACPARETVAVFRQFDGDRRAIRRQSVIAAIEGVMVLLRSGAG